MPGERGAVVALLCLGLCAFNLLQAIMYKVTGTSEKNIYKNVGEINFIMKCGN